jgi:DNA gyrase/topoisomerase IV subunit B
VLDRVSKDDTFSRAKFCIDTSTGALCVHNNGARTIPATLNAETGKSTLECMLTLFRSGSNFDDAQTRFAAGRNGFGTKITTHLSTAVKATTVDPANEKRVELTCADGCNPASIRVRTLKIKPNAQPFFEIAFTPDYAWAGGPDAASRRDTLAAYAGRVYEIAANMEVHGTTRKFKVTLDIDGVVRDIPCGLDKFAARLWPDRKTVTVAAEGKGGPTGARCRVAVQVLQAGEEAAIVAFVNGTRCDEGPHVAEMIAWLRGLVQAKFPKLAARSLNDVIRASVRCALTAQVPNPTFGSQTKAKLTTPASHLGFKVQFTDNDAKRVLALGLVAAVALRVDRCNEAALVKDLKVQKNVSLPGLDDAVLAGRVEKAGGEDVRLFLTEGKSAKAFVMTGLQAIADGRRFNGAFALRGCIQNQQTEKGKPKAPNDEVKNVRKILGVSPAMPHDLTLLRYSRRCICTGDFPCASPRCRIHPWRRVENICRIIAQSQTSCPSHPAQTRTVTAATSRA